MPSRVPQSRAFTLIELLLVIAIIALLGSFIISGLAASRQTARALLCVANLRSQMQSLASYNEDSKDAMPPLGEFWNRRVADDTFEASYWTMSRLLADRDGTPFAPEPDTPFFHPVGIWRCPQIPPDQDDAHSTHLTWVHSAPNGWIASAANVDDQTGDRGFANNRLDGWNDSYTQSWRRTSDFARPTDLIGFFDAASFYFAAHSHWHALETIIRADQFIPRSTVQHAITHPKLAVLPAAYLDGHAGLTPWRADYWQDELHPLPPSRGGAPLYRREARSILWFIDQ